MTSVNPYTDLVWVKVVYPDSSEYVFRGTLCKDICDSFGVSLPDSNYVFDVAKKKILCITDCDVTYHNLKPEYSRRVDEFASRFI
ncbi:MAG: hypothetical protein ACLR3R_19415 [Clostridium paraputrificum]